MTPGLCFFASPGTSQDREVGVVEGRRHDPYQDAGLGKRGVCVSRTIQHYCEMKQDSIPHLVVAVWSCLTCEEEKLECWSRKSTVARYDILRVVHFLFLFYFFPLLEILPKGFNIWGQQRWGDSPVSITRYSHLSEKRHISWGNHGQ